MPLPMYRGYGRRGAHLPFSRDDEVASIARTLEFSRKHGIRDDCGYRYHPILDAKQAELDRRNREDGERGGSAFSA